MIFFDNNTTTKLIPCVKDSMISYLDEYYCSPVCFYDSGIKSSIDLDVSRKAIADFLNCKPKNLFFTSGNTESINWVLKQFAEEKKFSVVTTKIESKTILNSLRYYNSLGYCKIYYCELDENYKVNISHLENILYNNMIDLAIFDFANGFTGSINNVEEISSLCKNRHTKVCIDASQAMGRINMDLSVLDIDYLTSSAHRMHGPKGIGILYCKEENNLLPLFYGEGQEKNKRAGTLNVPAIVGFAKACEYIKEENFFYSCMNLVNNVARDICFLCLKYKIDYKEISYLQKDNILPNTLTLMFPTLDSEKLLDFFYDEDVCVSGGEACSAGLTTPSYVLKELGHSKDLYSNAIRISFGKLNTLEECRQFTDIFEKFIKEEIENGNSNQ